MRNTVQHMTLTDYLEKWFATATARMTAKGVSVEISFVDFVNKVITPRQIASLQKTMDEGWLNARQARTSDLAYVITWKSYAARSTNVYSLDTAAFCTRSESKARAKASKGEKLRPSHCEKISAGLRDKPKAEGHCQNISEALAGRTLSEEHRANLKKPKKPWTEERRRQFSEAAKARAAEKKRNK